MIYIRSINFRGTSEYGNPYNDSNPWSIKWNFEDFDEFLFASGNMKYWMKASKDEILGPNGEKSYSKENVGIISSSLNCSSYSGLTFFHQFLWFQHTILF